MKIQFERQDSFYKITKTIEKIPDGRKVIFVIDPDNNMFANDWRGQQFRDLCSQKQLNYIVKTSSSRVKNYCDNMGISVEYDTRSPRITTASIIYSFFFKIRDFHYYATHKKQYIKYLVFIVEGLILLGVGFYVYGMLIPKATVTITPSYDIEDVSYNFRFIPTSGTGSEYTDASIAIPYHQGKLPYKRILRTSIQSVRYSAQTAKGSVQITNTTDREYALRPYTRFITDDNLVFRVNSWVSIPPAGSVTVELFAEEADDNGQIMGMRGNISSGTILYIRNLPESRTRKLIVATATSDFGGGDTLARGVVTPQDIEAFNELGHTTINQSVSQIIRESIKDPNIIPLMYSGMMIASIDNVKVDAKIGDPLLEFDGSVEATLTYHYITWTDVQQAIKQYFAQRTTNSLRLVSIQKESLKTFDPIVVSTGVYSIPTTLSTLRSYNFESDVAGVLPQIRDSIVNISKDDARQQVLSYPDISVAKVTISPFWYQSIPSIKSRIEFVVVDSSSVATK